MSEREMTDEQRQLAEQVVAMLDASSRNVARFALLLAAREYPDGAPAEFWEQISEGIKRSVRTHMEQRGLRYGVVLRVFQMRALNALAEEVDALVEKWGAAVPPDAVAALDCIPLQDEGDGRSDAVFAVQIAAEDEAPWIVWTGKTVGDAVRQLGAWHRAGVSIRSNIGSRRQ